MKDFDEKALAEQTKTVLDELLTEKLKEFRGEAFANHIRGIVDKLHAEKAVWGRDRSQLSDDQKSQFADYVRVAAFGGKTKSGEELLAGDDSRGGILIPSEVASGILRVARTVGVAMSRVTKWPINGSSVTVPAFTGALMDGEFLGFNTEGDITAVGFEWSNMKTELWQIAFCLDKTLLRDASVNLGEWLITLAAEALANRVDKEVFAGTGMPFVGITTHQEIVDITLGAGKDTFQEFDIVRDGATVEGSMEESLLADCAYFFNRTVWADLKVQTDDAGQFIQNQKYSFLQTDPRSAAGPNPVGYLNSYPVFTVRHLPALSASAASTVFGVFGNLKTGAAYAEKGGMTVEQYSSGTFGGKEIARANQQALVIKKEFGTGIVLPEAIVRIKTHS